MVEKDLRLRNLPADVSTDGPRLTSRLRRSSNLLEFPPDLVAGALRHPAQRQAVELIGVLLHQLGHARSPRELYELQRDLFAAAHEAQDRQAMASRAVKRSRQRVLEPPAELVLDQLVYDRVVRQLRSVGDALAWRVFRYDRRFILALSRNQDPGPMVGKKGLEYELGVVVSDFKATGTFTLLHDLTSCVRIGDATRCHEDGSFEVVEVKAGDRLSSEQKRRMNEAMAVLNEGAPLSSPSGPAELALSTVPLKTCIRSHLEPAIERADTDGLAWQRPTRRRLVLARSLTAPILRDMAARETVQWAMRRRAQAIAKSGLGGVLHVLHFLSADNPARQPTHAPYSIFPLPAETRARLICDYVVYEDLISFDQLQEAFEDVGFEVECLLPEAHVPTPRDVLRLRRGSSSVIVHQAAITQLLLEVVDLTRFAAAMGDRIREGGFGGAVLLFSNERAEWR